MKTLSLFAPFFPGAYARKGYEKPLVFLGLAATLTGYALAARTATNAVRGPGLKGLQGRIVSAAPRVRL